MNFEKSLACFRRQYPHRSIRFAYLYKGKWIFAMSLDGNLLKNDCAVIHEYVDSKGVIHVFDQMEALYNDPEGITKSVENATYIDMKKSSR